MKKIKAVFTYTLICIFIFGISVYADDVEIDEAEDISETIETVSSVDGNLKINSRAAIIYDRNSKNVIYEKEAYSKRKMASTTKIMTAIVVIENSNLFDTVIVSKKAAGTGGSRLGLKTGDKISINDLLYGLMLKSGNDAAVALAEYVGGSVEGFADMMNSKAEEIGLSNTHFVTPHGLDNDDHYCTAYELACMADYALKNEIFSNIVKTKSCTIYINGNAKSISNTNELLGNYQGVYGVKTGFTNGANRCLVTSIKRDTLDIIIVVLGADTKKYRTSDTVKLANYAIGNFEDIDITQNIQDYFEAWKEENMSKIKVIKGDNQDIKLKLNSTPESIITAKKADKYDVSVKINSLYNLEAPVKENEVVGTLYAKLDDEVKLQYDIVCTCKIEKRDLFDYLKLFFEKYSKNVLLQN